MFNSIRGHQIFLVVSMSNQSRPKDNHKKPILNNGLQLDDPEKLKKAIAVGSILASFYFFDQLAAEEWYEKDKDGNFKLKRKRILDEILE